jgi:NADH-quinone oxidoreductase subunit A
MLAEYSGVLVILTLALVVAAGMLAIHHFLGPRRAFASKLEPFECGERQIVSPHQRFSVKFYVVAMLFILFDVEAVFLYPWGALFTELGWFGFFEMLSFVFVLSVGLAYVWMKGALEW